MSLCAEVTTAYAGIDVIGAVVLVAFVKPAKWFEWTAIQQGTDAGGNTSGPVSLASQLHAVFIDI